MTINSTNVKLYMRSGMKTAVSKKMSETPVIQPSSSQRVSGSSVGVGTSTRTSTTDNSQHSARYNALNSLNHQTTRETLHRTPQSTFDRGTSPFVSGKRNVNPSDYKLKNTADAWGMYGDPFAKNRRTSMREITAQAEQIKKLMMYQQSLQGPQQTGQSKMAMLNGLFAATGSLAKGAVDIIGTIKEAKGSSTPTVSTSNIITAGSLAGKNVSSIINTMQGAENSASLKAGLDALDSAQPKLVTQKDKATEDLALATDQNKTATSNLENIEGNINSENNNIQKQSSNIQKFEGSLAMDKAELSRLQSQASTTAQSRIATLKTKIAETEAKLSEAKTSKANSETKLNTLKQDKMAVQTTITNTENSMKDSKAKLEQADTGLKEIADANKKYNMKLTSMQSKEAKKLASQQKDLNEFIESFKSEKNDNKKTRIAEKYAKVAAEYNNSLKGYAGSDFKEVTPQLV